MKDEGFGTQFLELRLLVESGTPANLEQFREQHQKALHLLEEIEKAHASALASSPILPKTRRSLSDYYNVLYHRGWTKRYLIEDLTELERRCQAAQEEPKKSLVERLCNSIESSRKDLLDRAQGA
jgi:hypothetical protein